MSETKKYMPWQNAGGPNECKHGYAAGIPCPHCDATKGVEDGITDEQAAAITPVIKPIAAIRSATPEELTAQRESYGKNYKPGPRQAVAATEEEDADCEGCNREDCKACAYNEAHPPPDFVTKAGTRIFIPPSAPVESATTEPYFQYCAEVLHGVGHCHFQKGHNGKHSWELQPSVPATTEARGKASPEMEQLFKKAIMATYDYWDSGQDMKVGKRLRALAGLQPGYDPEIDALLANIEGKG